MNRFASLSAIALLAAGCASQNVMKAEAAAAPRVEEPPRGTPPSASRVVELRHFYLLSPGPNAKLVVTRSDVSPSSTSSTEGSSAKAATPLLGLQ
jgi:hypothetical protein